MARTRFEDWSRVTRICFRSLFVSTFYGFHVSKNGIGVAGALGWLDSA